MSKINNSNHFSITAKADGGKAVIRITGIISRYWNGSDDFRASVDALIEKGITDAKVYIKTEGGDAIEANEIANIIAQFPGTITGEGGSMVCSAGTYIASKIKLRSKFELPTNGQYMIHKPKTSVHGDENEIKARLKLLKNVTEDYAQVYSECTGKTVDEIKEIWANGDVWMTAQEATDEGFISGVIKHTPISSEDIEALRKSTCPEDRIAALSVSQPKTTQKPTNNKEMDIKAIAITLGLPSDATEEQVNAKLAKMKEADKKLQELQTENERQRNERIKAILDNAVEKKQITAEQRGKYETLANHDIEAVESLLNDMPKVEKISGNLDSSTGKPGAERKDWTYAMYMEKAPDELQAMMKDDPATFKALYKEEYGVEPTLPQS